MTDLETDEFVGLDIALYGAVPATLEVAGWDLMHFTPDTVDRYEPSAGEAFWGPRSWDRIAAMHSWLLLRNAGVQPPMPKMALSMTKPLDVALAPLLALAVLVDEPLRAMGHGRAQYGRGVQMSVGESLLECIEDEHGVSPQHGPYYVGSEEVDSWSRDLHYVGQLAQKVIDDRPDKRFARAARQLLAVANDLHRVFDLPASIPLDMSTVLELLLLTGNSRDEGIADRVRAGAVFLAGVEGDFADEVRDFVGTLYDAGSARRHGGKEYWLTNGAARPGSLPKRSFDVARAYRLLRRLMLHGLALTAADKSLPSLCDRAQRPAADLDHKRQARLTRDRVLADMYDRLDSLVPPLARSRPRPDRG